MRLKQLSEQTIVITGASSGIGLTTARLARCRRFDYAGRRQRQQ